jgi:hypothetical protein
MSDRPASGRMPTPKQMERLAATPRRPPEAPYPGTRPADDLPEAYWEFIVQDHRGQIRTGVPIQQRRLSEIPRHVLRVTCLAATGSWRSRPSMRCASTVWKDVGMKLLDDGCRERTGGLEEDGCWPSFETT